MFLKSVINFSGTDTSTVGVQYVTVLIVIWKKHEKRLYKKKCKKKNHKKEQKSRNNVYMKINTLSHNGFARQTFKSFFLQMSYFSFYYFITTVYKHRSLKSLEIVIIYLVPETVSAVRIEPRKELPLLYPYKISNNFFFVIWYNSKPMFLRRKHFSSA